MAYIESWNEEKQSSYLYRIMALAESDPVKSTLFENLARAAEAQAGIWEDRIRRSGAVLPLAYSPSLRVRLVAVLIRYLGPRRLRPILAALKVRGMAVYSAATLAHGHPMPVSVEDIGHRHVGIGGGGKLRAAVFGVNDGLVSNTSLIMGVAGAGTGVKFILLSGVAGLLAGAFSMAAGEYISMRSQREMYEYQIGLEREELDEYPQEEAEELALIYNARGLALEEARHVAQEMIRDHDHAIDALAREELGLNPDDLGSACGAAASSFAAFALGSVIPLVPFMLKLGSRALPVAAVLVAVALFSVGALLSLFTGRRAWRSGLRMVLIGGTAAAATFLIGKLLGVSLS
ncbi:MAG: VIT1/CCC1 transporter family protein [Gammaproteobacteria bacterium]|nr:VIT1/CCC1 transporter family protein [Gammaproteobacteria bacterium]